MIVEPLTVEAAAALRPQPMQASHESLVLLRDPGYVRELAESGPAYAVRADGRVLALAGLADHGGGRALAWCYLADDVGRFMTGITRQARRYLDACAFRRVELISVAGWLPGERWALMLGFTFEGPSPSWFPDGRTAYRWGRVR